MPLYAKMAMPDKYLIQSSYKAFKPPLKYGWFHLKLYSMFQDLSRRLIETGYWRILRRGLNSLNSDTGSASMCIKNCYNF